MIDPIRGMLDYTGKPEKLIFGSGWPDVDYPRYLSSCVAAIPQQYHHQVFFENATMLFRKRYQ
jgi:predicted TIM-barrel fold metal-dependent hydrolase